MDSALISCQGARATRSLLRAAGAGRAPIGRSRACSDTCALLGRHTLESGIPCFIWYASTTRCDALSRMAPAHRVRKSVCAHSTPRISCGQHSSGAHQMADDTARAASARTGLGSGFSRDTRGMTMGQETLVIALLQLLVQILQSRF
jgi:hypothetical protein